MDVKKLTTHLTKNTLSEKEVYSLLTKLKMGWFETGYTKGYWQRDFDIKKIKRAANARRKKEYEQMIIQQDK